MVCTFGLLNYITHIDPLNNNVVNLHFDFVLNIFHPLVSNLLHDCEEKTGKQFIIPANGHYLKHDSFVVDCGHTRQYFT